MTGLCGNKCKHCKYSKRLRSFGASAGNVFCDYLDAEGKCRPCKAGDDCTVYVPIAIKRKHGSKRKAQIV